MGGKNGRGENGGFNAAGRDNGQSHSQRTLANAGNILHGKDLFVSHKNTPYSKFSILYHIITRNKVLK
jgi:hypothetical protein